PGELEWAQLLVNSAQSTLRSGSFENHRRSANNINKLSSEPYRQLKQRVESHVATFLSKQTFSANLPKNQLRTSLRANINQSEVLSKGVDRLLEQVLVEKSSSFYKEIENLVEEHLIGTGHYTRYERDRPQRSDAQPRSELTKLSDKEVEDIIKEETNKLLEASADEKSQESDRGSFVDTPPPGTSGEVIEVETLISTIDDNDGAQTSQVLGTNVEAIVNSTPELSTGKPSVEMSASEESALKDETLKNLQADESKVSNAQNADEISQTDVSKGQQMLALYMSEKSASAETGQISQKPEIITESNPASASATLDGGLQNKNEAMDIDDELSSSTQNTSEIQGKIDENIPEIERSDDCKPAVEKAQSAVATIVQTSFTEQRDIPKGSTLEIDLQAVKPGSELKESKAETKDANIVENTTAEMKEAKIYKPKVYNPEATNPDKPEANLIKHEEAKFEVVKSGEVKPEIVKPELAKPEVSIPKVDKTRKPEVDKSSVVKADVSKVETGKPKVDKVSKPEVNKLRIVKPEVGKSKVGKRPEEKAKKKTEKQQNKLSSEESMKSSTKKPISMPNIFSKDKVTDEDLGIPSADIPGNEPEKSKPELSEDDIVESDSDITVSSVHTSDLSSLEDSMSDMEYEDYQELVLKKSKDKESGATTSKESEESGAGTVKVDMKEKTDGRKSAESGAGTSTNVGGESGAGTSEKVDTKEKSEGKYSSVSVGDTAKTSDINEKKSSADTSMKSDDGCSVTTSKSSDQSDIKEESGDKQSGVDSSKKIDIKAKDEKFGESGAETNEKTEGMSKENKAGESVTTVSKDSDDESSEVVSEKNDSKDTRTDESGVATDKEVDSNVELAENTTSALAQDLTTTDSPQTTEEKPSDSTDSPLPACQEDEDKLCSKGEEQTNLQSPMSDPALFKPIDPAEPQVFPEPEDSQHNEPAYAQATDDASDADNETTMEDYDIGSIKLGKRRRSRRFSNEQESESSNDTTTPTEEQKEAQPQRRSARVASKDQTRPDEKDDHSQGNIQKGEEGGDSSRKLRRTRYSQEKTHEVRTSRSKEERRNEKAEKRAARRTSESTDSDIKLSKRSKRTVKPTRCYSPSENS
ncbi:Hypothetical predicted protein, partial [Paramuricea clavata]